MEQALRIVERLVALQARKLEEVLDGHKELQDAVIQFKSLVKESRDSREKTPRSSGNNIRDDATTDLRFAKESTASSRNRKARTPPPRSSTPPALDRQRPSSQRGSGEPRPSQPSRASSDATAGCSERDHDFFGAFGVAREGYPKSQRSHIREGYVADNRHHHDMGDGDGDLEDDGLQRFIGHGKKTGYSGAKDNMLGFRVLTTEEDEGAGRLKKKPQPKGQIKEGNGFKVNGWD